MRQSFKRTLCCFSLQQLAYSTSKEPQGRSDWTAKLPVALMLCSKRTVRPDVLVLPVRVGGVLPLTAKPRAPLLAGLSIPAPSRLVLFDCILFLLQKYVFQR